MLFRVAETGFTQAMLSDRVYQGTKQILNFGTNTATAAGARLIPSVTLDDLINQEKKID